MLKHNLKCNSPLVFKFFTNGDTDINYFMYAMYQILYFIKKIKKKQKKNV